MKLHPPLLCKYSRINAAYSGSGVINRKYLRIGRIVQGPSPTYVAGNVKDTVNMKPLVVNT